MPELPEVDEIVTQLCDRNVNNGYVVGVNMIRNPQNAKSEIGRYDGIKQIFYKKLCGIYRRGKYMTFHFEHGILVCHNAMSGFWDVKGEEWCFDYVEGARTSKDSDVRFEFSVKNSETTKIVRFHDARLFGFAKWYPVRSIEEIPGLAKLGPEAITTKNTDPTTSPLKTDWNVLDAAYSLNPNVEIKHALMDQDVVAGFGNIYAAETLFKAGIDPFRITKTLSTDEWSRLYSWGQRVLERAIERKLSYSNLAVYRQKECFACEGFISKKDLRGRSTYFCPNCQK